MEHGVYGIVFGLSVSLQLQLEDGRDILGYLDGEFSELSVASGSDFLGIYRVEAVFLSVRLDINTDLHRWNNVGRIVEYPYLGF